MNVTVLLAVAAVVELGGIIALGVLLIVSRRQLNGARTELERSRRNTTRRGRRRPGVAPFAIRTAWKTADSLMTKGIGATFRNSVEDLAGWARSLPTIRSAESRGGRSTDALVTPASAVTGSRLRMCC